MSRHRDGLDHAIDAVAARMMAVAEDDGFAQRIASALPERPAWSWHWLMPRLAITAAIVAGVSAVVIKNGHTTLQPAVQPAVQAVAQIVQPTVQPAVQANVRRSFRTNVQPNDRLNDRDNEHSLPALETASVPAFDSLAPMSLPEDAPLTLEPLAIADLPLTAETNSERSVEEQR